MTGLPRTLPLHVNHLALRTARCPLCGSEMEHRGIGSHERWSCMSCPLVVVDYFRTVRAILPDDDPRDFAT